jgi:hypothetical protein
MFKRPHASEAAARELEEAAIMGAIVTTVVYLILAITIAAIVGLALARSGRAFLGARFGADDGVAPAVNRLVLVAYSLLTGGFIALTLPSWSHVAGPGEALRLLSARLGVLLLALGALHLTATAVFARLRRAQPGPAPARTESEPGDELTPSALWQPRRVAP